MKQLITHIIHWALGILLVVLTVANAMAQKPAYLLEYDQCETVEFSVVDWPGDRYTWDLYTELEWDTVNFAKQDGNVEAVPFFEGGMDQGSTVKVNWLETGRYFLRVVVWDEVRCTNNLEMFLVDVLESKPEATVEGGEACYGDPVIFKIILTGSPPWDISYTYGDGTAVLNLNGLVETEQTVVLPPLPAGTFDFWVTEIIDQCTSNLIPSEKGRVVIFPKPTNSKIYQVND